MTIELLASIGGIAGLRSSFACYLTSGAPPGACDPRPPRASRGLLLAPGGIFFATESPVWTGGAPSMTPP